MALATKVIVTSRVAMRAKYGAPGWAAVRSALRTLVAADKARGIATRVVTLDPADTPAAVKQRIDALFASAPPDYVMLLGAPDVVPQCRLDNPLWNGNPNDDADQFVPSDLPYACDVPLSTSCAAYRGPTRVVGRLPDLMGATNPAYLIGLIRRASRASTVHIPRPVGVLAISTLTWRRSTQTSIAALGGAAGVVHTCPTEGPAWSDPLMNVPLMFVNCHGAQFEPRWFGEKFAGQAALPTAVEAARLRGVVRPGMTVASECCYGTMHWDPARAGGQPGVAATLLDLGAAAVFGSSTIAYGPAVGNANADVIARMFLEAIASGASTGRATLEARQRFVASLLTLDPTDLKTLAQFDLLGDPSIHPIAPVRAGADTPRPKSSGAARGGAPAQASGPGPDAAQRRSALQAIGEALNATVATTADQPRERAGLSRSQFAALAGIDPAGLQIRTFDLAPAESPGEPPAASPDNTPAASPANTADTRGRRNDVRRASTPSRAAFHIAFTGRAGRRAVVVVRTDGGTASSVRRLERKSATDD